MRNSLDNAYLEHYVFKQLKTYSEFYESLSDSVFRYLNPGVKAFVNIDTYILSSIQGTLESIHDILHKGRINDAYALLRKYYDSAIINIYVNLYLSENFSINNFTVQEIEDWVHNTNQIPSFKTMSIYIQNSTKLSALTQLMYTNGSYTQSLFNDIRNKCNEHTHYLYFKNILSNDNSIYNQNRISMLNDFDRDLTNLFILHFSYLFYLNEHYMTSSDYIDALDAGLTPEEDSQYWVAPFVQEIFDNVIRKNRPDIAKMIKDNVSVHLQ